MSDAVTLTESALWFAERQPTGFLVALWLDPETAAQLAVGGGESAGALHITLCHCGDAGEMDELAVMRAVAAVDRDVRWRSPLKGKISGYGRFDGSETSDGQDVFYASVDIPGLVELRQCVASALMEAGMPPSMAHGYNPHITLAYVASDAKNPVKDLPPLPLMFDAVTAMVGTKRIDVPFVPPMVEMFAVRRDAAYPGHLTVSQPVAAFADPPEWAPCFPIPGIYQHPLYGELNFSPAAYDQIIANFKGGIYQEKLPVNVQHEQYSSAVGWITDMRLAGDGSIEAKVDWTQRGKALIDDDRYLYVSAEWFDQWSPPDDPTVVYDNVAVGLTLCTNPYFKESVLRPLAASEAVITRVADAATPSIATAGAPGTEELMGNQNPQTPPVDPAQAPPVVAPTPPLGTDDTVKQLTERILAELGGGARISDPIVQEFAQKAALELHEAQAQAKQATDRAKALTDQNAMLQAQNRVKTFTDEVMGHGGQSGIAYVGHIPDMVRMLCNLANTYGDTSWEVEHYKTLNRSHAEQIKAGSLFAEIGTARGGDATQTAEDQIEMQARALMATDPKLTHAQAFTQVLNSNAELRAAHARERHQGGR